jgi:hypothetical protein
VAQKLNGQTMVVAVRVPIAEGEALHRLAHERASTASAELRRAVRVLLALRD